MALLKQRPGSAIHYKPERCALILSAPCVLHNIALKYNISDSVQDLSNETDKQG